MAVIQISKIQVRRGLQEDLPQLASGEFGWSVDTQRLWIGNGTLVEGAPQIGNTEILTSGRDILSVIKSYTFEGKQSGYISQTGPTRNVRVKRSLQDKFDDLINFRDFIENQESYKNPEYDYTEALQRAIDQIFPQDYYNTVGVRRILYIPAGVWKISDTLTIPPYANIQGEGINSTFIRQIYGSNGVIRLRSSRGTLGSDIDTATSDTPHQITFNNLTLQTDQGSDVAFLESCENIYFDHVRFEGAISNPVSDDNISGVRVTNVTVPVKRITFDHCEFANTNYGLRLIGDVSNVVVNNCQFDMMYKGVCVNTMDSDLTYPTGVEILGSVFDNIASNAIYITGPGGVVSAFNYFKTVGKSDGSVIDSGAVVSPVILFSSANNCSIGDLFDRSFLEHSVVAFANSRSISFPTIANTRGSVQDYSGVYVSIADSDQGNIGTILTETLTSVILDYKIQRGSINRIGTIRATHVAGSNVVFEDDYSETADAQVTLGFVGNTVSKTVSLTYTTTSVGSSIDIKFTVRSFI
jgi:hypothetical protein